MHVGPICPYTPYAKHYNITIMLTKTNAGINKNCGPRSNNMADPRVLHKYKIYIYIIYLCIPLIHLPTKLT
ncbi:hypothetical protein LOK49_LG07G01271 [Camellia lanceoleosa]|uniref:Uncharacterized protein n=1 Tax=Camellia lanceoleosa TaxID=1840588 RepID=A0ACC0GX36_9ERIC|nr:hypothetical protein LOK49_LG07G01271 [Camellia lanceoleosa]